MASNYNYTIFPSRVGDIFAASTPKGLFKLHFPASDIKITDVEVYYNCKLKKDDKALADVKKEMLAYLDGDLNKFSVKVDFIRGTDFQKKVWKVLLKIPYGQALSYADVAKKVGKPTAYRAVGGANHNNPIPIIVPCHRVIGKDGSMTGYGGPSEGGKKLKKEFLEMEGAL